MRNLQEVPNSVVHSEFEHPQADANASRRHPPFRKGIEVKEECDWDATPWTDRRPASVTRDCSFSEVLKNSDNSWKRKWVQREEEKVTVGLANAPVRRRLNRGSAVVEKSTPTRNRISLDNSDVPDWAGDWESPVPTTHRFKSDQEFGETHDMSQDRRDMSTRANAKKCSEDIPSNRPHRSSSKRNLDADGIHSRSDVLDGRDDKAHSKAHSTRFHSSTEQGNGRPHHRESSIQSERTYANRFGDPLGHSSGEKDFRSGSIHGFHAGRHQDRFQGGKQESNHGFQGGKQASNDGFQGGKQASNHRFQSGKQESNHRFQTGKPPASGERFRKETSQCRYSRTGIPHTDRRPKCFGNPTWKLPLRVNQKTGEPWGDGMKETVMKKIRFVMGRHVPISQPTWQKLPKELKRKLHTEVQGFFQEGHTLKPAWITSEAAKIYRKEVKNVERELLEREWGTGPLSFKRTKYC